MSLIISLLVNAAALLVTTYLIPGFKIQSFTTAILIAVVLGFINAFFGPIVRTLTSPLNWLTLGLFSLVINAAFLVVVSELVPGFTIESFWPTAIISGLVLAVISTILAAVLQDVSKLL